MYNIGIEEEEEELEIYAESRGNFVPSWPEVQALADRIEGSSLDTASLLEFVTTRTVDNDCRPAATTAGQRKTSFSYDADDLLVGSSSVEGASQSYVPAALRTCVLRLCHYALMARYPGGQRVYDAI